MLATRRPRSGFTITEMLVVIAIIAVLLSLGGGALFYWIGSRQSSNTALALRKVKRALDQHWSYVIEEAKREPMPSNLLAAANNDNDRARVLLIKLRLMEAFPISYSEITSPVIYTPNASNLYLPSSIRKYNNTYSKRLNGKTAAANPATESAACLLIALSVSRGGNKLTEDDLPDAAKDTDQDGFKEVADGWGNAILFSRFGFADPALQAARPAQAGKNARFADPVDPGGALLNPGWYGSGTRSAFESLTQYSISPDSGTSANYVIPVLVSAGANGKMGVSQSLAVGTPSDATDNLYTYQLRTD